MTVNSYWEATSDPATEFPPLPESTRAGVAIVGGGITGLSTALHLAEAGMEPVLLEAHQPAWGASGRNGGQLVPLLKHDPDELTGILGPQGAEQAVRVVSGAVGAVEELVRRHAIECEFEKTGWLQLAHSDAAFATARRRAEQWSRRGVPVEVLGKDETRHRIGGGEFSGAWFDPRAGLLHPLKYTRGLAEAAHRAGAMIFGGTRVEHLERKGTMWELSTSDGQVVRANKVLLATNAYSGNLRADLRHAVLPVNSLMIATAPLPPARLASILPRREGVSTTHRLVYYFRVTRDGRLLLGGRGQYRDNIGPGDYAHLERRAAALFGDVGRVDYRWGGRVAMTRDFLPRVGEIAPGLVACVGFNGRGVALATAMGSHLAHHLAGTSTEQLPFSQLPWRQIPFPSLRRLYLFAGFAVWGALDRHENRKTSHPPP